jgi:hypothetical protein
MVDNKYYTPSIEEFYVGFEYDREGVFNGDTTWTTMIYGKEPFKVDYKVFPDFLENDLKNVRVKYLDKDDIKSLGWMWNDLGVFELTKNTIDQVIEPKKITYRLISYPGGRWEIRPSHPSYNFGMYLGTIKNKSELKVLMKQLGI